jgi:hypothetical protein
LALRAFYKVASEFESNSLRHPALHISDSPGRLAKLPRVRIEAISARGAYEQQHRYLLRRCLEVLPFLDGPEKGIARVREVLATTRLHGFELRDLFGALGNSRCPEALDLLLELAGSSGNPLHGAGVEWIDAVTGLDTPESKRVLLSFVDPDLENPGVPHRFEHHELDALASYIADVARRDVVVRNRLYRLCSSELEEERRILLARIVGRLRTEDALIAGLNLLRDDADPPVPFDLARSLEEVFVERCPEGESRHTYTLEPRAANAILARLFKMSLEDNRRKEPPGLSWVRLRSGELSMDDQLTRRGTRH